MRTCRPAELVMGSVQLGLAYGIANRTGKPAHGAAVRMLQRAADAGVTSFDTARTYGDAEERLGDALAGRPVRTVTKLASLDQLTPDFTEAAVVAAVDDSIAQSCAALRVERLDCLLLHRAAHRTAFGGAIWRRLRSYVDQGIIRALGVSVQTPHEALAALTDSLVKHIQLPFNVLDWRWQDAGVIAALRTRSDVTVHARSVFLQGLFVAGDPAVWPRIDGVDVDALTRWLADTAAEFGRESAADLCLAYARGQSWIDGVVVGMESDLQLDTNLRLCVRAPLSLQDCVRIEERRPRVPAQLLDPAQWPR